MMVKFLMIRLFVILLVAACGYAYFFNEDSREVDSGSDSDQLVLLSDELLQKRNLNTYKNMMLNKDNLEVLGDGEASSRDNPLYYIPRVASVNGKRGAILSWTLPGNRMRIASQNYRQSSFGINNGATRPAAKK